MQYEVKEKFIPTFPGLMLKESVLSNPILNLEGNRFDRYDLAMQAATKAITETDIVDLLVPNHKFDVQIEKVFEIEPLS